MTTRYLGETEAKLRALFARARAAAPCILFLDELDAITAKRGDGGDADGGDAGSVYARVLSTLLNEMDGVATSGLASSSGGAVGGVLVLAATNRRDALDAALLRPGRLHESVELGMPGREDREGVLKVYAKRLPLSAEMDLPRLCQDDVSGGLTCADIEVGMLPGGVRGGVGDVPVEIIRSRNWVRLSFWLKPYALLPGCHRGRLNSWRHGDLLWPIEPEASFGKHVYFFFFSAKRFLFL